MREDGEANFAMPGETFDPVTYPDVDLCACAPVGERKGSVCGGFRDEGAGWILKL